MAGEGVTQGSTLYAGSVSNQAIYKIKKGEGFTWGKHVRTEINVDAKPRQLTRGIHTANPLIANVKNPAASNFNASTSVTTINGRQLSVAEMILLENFDINNWKGTFVQYQPNGLSVDLQASPEINQAVRDLIFDACHNQINALHSAGDTGAGDLYNGFVTLMLADADATEVGTPAALTSMNIVDKIRELKNAIPSRLYNAPLAMFISHADANLFADAAADTQTSDVVTRIEGQLVMILVNGRRVPIVPVDGIPKDHVFVTPAGEGADSNLVQGFWMEADKDTLLLYKENPADQIHRLVFRICVGVQYYTGDDIFYLAYDGGE
jgi:hypothetical protein